MSPTSINVESALEELRGRPVFFDPLYGNNGDKLIELGSRVALERAGVRLVEQPGEAEVLVINGGGGAGVDLWDHDFRQLGHYLRGFAGVPLIVLPSSFHFSGSKFAQLFEGRDAPALLFARELHSFELIKAQAFPPCVRCMADHDMAWHLHNSAFLNDLKASASNEQILIAERFDREASTPLPARVRMAAHFRRRIPRRLLRWIKANPVLHAVNTSFSREMIAMVHKNHPETAGLPVVVRDISRQATFPEFVRQIAQSAVVVSTRLHVGLLAAMLEKPVYLKGGGPGYRKIEGCFEFTLRGEGRRVHLL